MKILHLISSLILITVYSFYLFKYFICLYQLEHYDLIFAIKRYFKCDVVKRVYLGWLLIEIVWVLLVELVFKIRPTYLTLVSFAISLVCIFYQLVKCDTSKTPLKLTKRIVRLIIIYLVLLVACFIVKVKYLNGLACVNFSVFNVVLCVIVTLIAITISYIIELIIKKHYVNIAVKKLKKYPNIIKIGIVGSYAKTSVKNILSQILSRSYNVVATPKSYNTLLGIVKTIRELVDNKTEVLILEIGADKNNDIKNILKIFDINIGVLTGITNQHLEKFKTLENLIKTKLYICDYINSKNGQLFLNAFDSVIIDNYSNIIDNNYENINNNTIVTDSNIYNSNIINKLKNCIKFNKFLVNNIKYENKIVKFDINVNQNSYSFETNLLGKHSLINISLCIAVALYLNVPVNKISSALKHLKQTPHRMEIKKLTMGATLIDNSFNSNSVGFKYSLELLNSFDGKNKIVITPGLVELGSEQSIVNYNLGKSVGEYGFDLIICNYVNRDDIEAGYRSVNDKDIVCYDNFSSDLVSYLNTLDETYCILIENDLPSNYS